MKLLSLCDNPLFIRNAREQLKPYKLGSMAFVLIFILGLIVIGNAGQAGYGGSDALRGADAGQWGWLGRSLYQAACVQGFLLLFFGTMSVFRHAAEERTSGTLDFHRASPVQRRDQVIGCVLGGAVLEWTGFLAITVLILSVVLLTGGPLGVCFLFYLSIVCTALFMHAFAAWVGLLTQPGKRGLSVPVIVFLLCLYSVFVALSRSTSVFSIFMYASWLPAYEMLNDVLAGGRSLGHSLLTETFFWGIGMPGIYLQFLVQIPLGFLMGAGVRRRFMIGDKTNLSKAQFMLLVLLLYFYFFGCAVNIFLQGGKDLSIAVIGWSAFILVYGLLFAGTFAVTPDRLSYRKGLARVRREGRAGLIPDDDRNSNLFWLGTFLCATTLFLWGLSRLAQVPLPSFIGALSLILVFAVAFAQGVEAFRLSIYHRKSIFLWVALALLWMGLPVLGSLLNVFPMLRHVTKMFNAFSPFFHNILVSGIFFRASVNAQDLMSFLIINIPFAAAMVIWAGLERRRSLGAVHL